MRFSIYYLFIQVQKIVDHHHASDQRSATKVRFTEPSEENGEMFNEDDEDYKVRKIPKFQYQKLLLYMNIDYVLYAFVALGNRFEQKRGN